MDTINVKLLGVKQRIIRARGKAWGAFCVKEREFVANSYENDRYYEIWDIQTDEAVAFQERKHPKGLAIHGKPIKENLWRNKKHKITRTFYHM